MTFSETFDLSKEEVKFLGKEYRYFPEKILDKGLEKVFWVNLSLLAHELREGFKTKKYQP